MRYLIPSLLALLLVLPAASAFAAPAGHGHDWKANPHHYTRQYRPSAPVARHWTPAPRSTYRNAPATPSARWYRHHRPTVKAHPYPGNRYYAPWRRW